MSDKQLSIPGLPTPEPKPKLVPETRLECDACGITIGPGYMETTAYPVGKYKICGHCLRQLRERGRIQVQPYSKPLSAKADSFSLPSPTRDG